MDMFLSDKREELEKEKKKQDAIRFLMPKSFEGIKDDTAYYLAENNWSSLRRLTDGTFAPFIDEKNKKENAMVNNVSRKESLFDPWEYYKYVDSSEYKDNFAEVSKRKFETIIPIILGNEGGYSNHKNDKGGETNYGITKPFYEDYKHCAPGIAENIKDITKEDAVKLYKGHWDKFKIGYINDKRKAILLYDYMINSNAYKVTKRLQDSLNTRGYNLSIDGIMGPKTIEAVNDVDFDNFANFLQNDRRRHLESLIKKDSTQKTFINGWMNRIKNMSDSVSFKSKN